MELPSHLLPTRWLLLMTLILLPSTITSFSISSISFNKQNAQVQTFNIQITHQNKTATIPIRTDEPILQALERHNLHDTLSLPALPQDCRKGSCLTCAGKLLSSEKTYDSVQLVNDGLSPSMAKKIQKEKLVLTCSSYVIDEGVHLEIGVCDDVWREVYGSTPPFEDAEGERIKNDAVAKAIRVKDEKSLNRWALRTEKSFMDDEDSDNGNDYDGSEEYS